MYENDANHQAASCKIIFDLFSFNELDIFLGKETRLHDILPHVIALDNRSKKRSSL